MLRCRAMRSKSRRNSSSGMDHEIARLEVPVAVHARQPVARRGQIGVEGSQHPLVIRSRRHLSLADDVVAVEVIELEQEAIAVECACRGEIVRSERGLPLSVEEDDEVAGLAVEPFGLAGTPPTRPRIEKLLLQGDVSEVLRQHEPKGWVGSEYAWNGCSNRREHPVVAEQGSGRGQ